MKEKLKNEVLAQLKKLEELYNNYLSIGKGNGAQRKSVRKELKELKNTIDDFRLS